MERHEGMDMGKGAPKGPEKAGAPENGADAASVELSHRADSLGDSLRSFEKEMDGADAMLAKIKDPAKREEFTTALASLRGRTGGLGNALRGAVAGIALFAGGVGVGKGMNDERHEAAMIDVARQAAAAEVENRMLRQQLAEKKPDVAAEAKVERVEKASEKVIDAMAEQNNMLRQQLTEMQKELARLRQERDEANARVIAEKEKGLVTQDTLFKQQAVSGNLEQLYKKMKDLIDGSGDPKLKEDADRFLAA
ncbi:MAG TPA: hypothetical protein VL426_01840, partial [Candidatus Binatia bacterium]|nr:hypothetical protein [Candidatus Binatia bacterium]